MPQRASHKSWKWRMCCYVQNSLQSQDLTAVAFSSPRRLMFENTVPCRFCRLPRLNIEHQWIVNEHRIQHATQQALPPSYTFNNLSHASCCALRTWAELQPWKRTQLLKWNSREPSAKNQTRTKQLINQPPSHQLTIAAQPSEISVIHCCWTIRNICDEVVGSSMST